jgi:hypothetical protein
MIKILPLSLFLFISLSAFSQIGEKVNRKEKTILKSLTYTDGSTQEIKYYVSPEVLKKRIRTDFGRIATGSPTEGPITSFASLDVADGSLKAAYTNQVGKSGKFFFTGEVKAKSDDNFFSVFGGDKFKPEASLKLNIHWRPSLGTVYYYTKEQKTALQEKLDLTSSEWDYKKAQLGKAVTEYDAKITLITKTISLLNAEKAKKQTAAQTNEEFAKLQASLVVDIANLQQQEDSLKAFKVAFTNKVGAKLKKIDEEKKEALEAVQLAAPWNGIRMFWLSGFFSGSGKEYNVFDTMVSPRRLESDYTFLTGGYSWGARVNLMWWRKATINTALLSAGFENVGKEKFSGIEKDIAEASNVTGITNGNSYQLKSSHKAYDRNTLSTKYYTDFFGDFLWYPFKTSVIAFTGNILSRTSKGDNPDVYITPGILLNATKKVDDKKKKEIVSLNIYWRAKTKNASDIDYKFKENSDFGIRVNLPLNPVTFFTEKEEN